MARWSERTGIAAGSIISFEECWALARRWYEGRHLPGWERKSPAAMEAILEDVGLRARDPRFWSLRDR